MGSKETEHKTVKQKKAEPKHLWSFFQKMGRIYSKQKLGYRREVAAWN